MSDWTDGIGDEPQDMFEPKIIFTSPWENTGNWKRNCDIVMSKEPKKTDFVPKWAIREENCPDEPGVLAGYQPTELPPPDPTGTLNGTWCKKVWSGLYVNLQHPTPDVVRLDDISVSLHNQCRYNGHTPFYSVAEHSILAAQLAKDDGRSQDEVRAVLMHDSAECYLGDVSRPLKLYLRSIGVTIYDELTAKWDTAIGERFGIDFARHHDIVKHYDFILMKAEKERFWPEDKEEWSCLDDVPLLNVDWLHCKPDDVRLWTHALNCGIK